MFLALSQTPLDPLQRQASRKSNIHVRFAAGPPAAENALSNQIAYHHFFTLSRNLRMAFLELVWNEPAAVKEMIFVSGCSTA